MLLRLCPFDSTRVSLPLDGPALVLSRAVLVLVWLCISASGAMAEGLRGSFDSSGAPVSSQAYASVETGVLNSRLPSVQYGEVGWAPSTTDALFSDRPMVSSFLIRGTIGYLLTSDALPRALGCNARLEGVGSWWSGSEVLAASRPSSTTATFRSVDGSSQLLFGSGSPAAQLRTEVEGFETALRLTSDFSFGERITFSPMVGLAGGTRGHTHNINIATPFAGGTMENPIDFHASLRRRALGVELGSDIAVRVYDGLTIHAGIRGALLPSRDRLVASYCLGNAVPIGSACDGGFYQTGAQDQRDILNRRLDISLGAGFAAGIGQLGISGFGRMESHTPGIRAPTAANPLPAAIKYDRTYSYGMLVNYVLPLNGV